MGKRSERSKDAGRQKRALSKTMILRWADAHRARTGRWPTAQSGGIPNAQGVTWNGVEMALRQGYRGLPGGSSLATLLRENRGASDLRQQASLTHKQILAWADAHRERHGRYPRVGDGVIAGAPGENWQNIDACLRQGLRDLPGGDSLYRLLQRERGHRRGGARTRPTLTLREVVKWAEAHAKRTGRWPSTRTGRVRERPRETWAKIDLALRWGSRGLPPDFSLSKLLARYRATKESARGQLRIRDIVAWADEHHRRTGRWPRERDTTVYGKPEESWEKIDLCLRIGLRGLPGGESLSELLERYERVNRRQRRRRLTPRERAARAGQRAGRSKPRT